MKFSLMLSLTIFSQSLAFASSVKPDIVTNVDLSNTDANRVVCVNGKMNDVFFSTDKIENVPLVGKYGFIKFPIMKKGNELSYVVKHSEFHFICNGMAYTIMASPRSIPAQVIYLGDNTISNAKKNIDLMGSMPREKQSLYLTQIALKNEVPSNFKVSQISPLVWESNLIANAEIALVKTLKVDGVGLKLREYLVRSKVTQYLDEKRFVLPHLSKSIRAITVDPLEVESGGVSRVFIVEDSTN